MAMVVKQLLNNSAKSNVIQPVFTKKKLAVITAKNTDEHYTDRDGLDKWLADNSMVPDGVLVKLFNDDVDLLSLTVKQYKTIIKNKKKKHIKRLEQSNRSRVECTAKGLRGTIEEQKLKNGKNHVPIEYGGKEETEHVHLQAKRFWRTVGTSFPYNKQQHNALVQQQKKEQLRTPVHSRPKYRLLQCGGVVSSVVFTNSLAERLRQYKNREQTESVSVDEVSIETAGTLVTKETYPMEVQRVAHERALGKAKVLANLGLKVHDAPPEPKNSGQAIANIGLINDEVKLLKDEVRDMRKSVDALLGMINPMKELVGTVREQSQAVTAMAEVITKSQSLLNNQSEKLDDVMELTSEVLATVDVSATSILDKDAASHMASIQEEYYSSTNQLENHELEQEYKQNILHDAHVRMYDDHSSSTKANKRLSLFACKTCYDLYDMPYQDEDNGYCSEECHDKAVGSSGSADTTGLPQTMYCMECEEPYLVGPKEYDDGYCSEACHTKDKGFCSSGDCDQPNCTDCRSELEYRLWYWKTFNKTKTGLFLGAPALTFFDEHVAAEKEVVSNLTKGAPLTYERVEVYKAPNENSIRDIIKSGRLNNLINDYTWDGSPLIKFTHKDRKELKRYKRWFKQAPDKIFCGERRMRAHLALAKRHERVNRLAFAVKTGQDTSKYTMDVKAVSKIKKRVVINELRVLSEVSKSWDREDAREYRRMRKWLQYHEGLPPKFERRVYKDTHNLHNAFPYELSQFSKRASPIEQLMRDHWEASGIAMTAGTACMLHGKSKRHSKPTQLSDEYVPNFVLVPDKQVIDVPSVIVDIKPETKAFIPEIRLPTVMETVKYSDGGDLKEILSEFKFDSRVEGIMYDIRNSREPDHPLLPEMQRVMRELCTRSYLSEADHSILIEEIVHLDEIIFKKERTVYSLPNKQSKPHHKMKEVTGEVIQPNPVMSNAFARAFDKVKSATNKVKDTVTDMVDVYKMNDVDEELIRLLKQANS